MSFNSDKTIENFVTLIQDRISGVVFIGEQTDNIRPSKVENPLGFSSCKLRTITSLGSPEYLEANLNGEQSIIFQDKIEIEIQTFGPNALGRLNGLKNEFGKRSISNELIDIHLSFVRVSNVLDISTTLDTDWEQRAQMSITFNIATCIVDNVGIIEKVTISTGDLIL